MQKPGHVVVCGVDDTALRTIEQLLAAGADVVVVDAVAEAGAVAERLLEQWDVPLVHGRLREAQAGQVRVVALQRADGHLEHRLRRDTGLAAGDEAYLVGRPDEVMQVLRRDVAASP